MSRMMTAGSGSITPMWRRDSNGTLIKIDEPNRDQEVTPSQGVQCRFLLSGISESFELDGQFGITAVVRLEFTILKAKGNVSTILNGKYFTQLFTWKVSAKSKLGQLLGVLRGREIQAGEQIDPDWFIGTTFVTSTKLTSNGNPAISIETIDPSSIELSPHVPKPMGQLNALGASARAANAAPAVAAEDPWEGSEEETL